MKTEAPNALAQPDEEARFLRTWNHCRAHSHELFRRRRVNTDSRVELGLSGAAIHCHGQPLDNLSGIRADHMAAQDSVCLVIDNDFHHGSFTTTAQGMLERFEGGLVNVDLSVAGYSLRFR